MTPVQGDLAVRYATVALPFGKLPTPEQVAADALSREHARRKRAEHLRRTLAEKGKLPESYPHYPIQVVRLGDQVTWVALGGEAVVDYSRRLKKELAGSRSVWVTAYANDVMAYIPSERVLSEGGYEADSSMVFYGQPGKWAPAIEGIIVGKVRELVGGLDGRPSR
jgi:hypothetical protein